jgi:hypothetical protein
MVVSLGRTVKLADSSNLAAAASHQHYAKKTTILLRLPAEVAKVHARGHLQTVPTWPLPPATTILLRLPAEVAEIPQPVPVPLG